ncbi:MAG: hypothetical protein AAF830_11400 [Pseudomonadota bacterium]
MEPTQFSSSAPDDEPLPFISNFQDVFLATGVVLLLVGLTFGAVQLTNGLSGGETARTLAISIVFIAASAGLSEVLVRKRRRTLPGIVLALVFVGSTITAVMAMYSFFAGAGNGTLFDQFANVDAGSNEVNVDTDFDWETEINAMAAEIPWVAKLWFVLTPLAAAWAGMAYYLRYRLPFSVAMIAGSAAATVFVICGIVAPATTVKALPLLQLLLGLAVLVAAIGFDMRDPERVTRFSNNGFWLHFAAAPMVLGGALAVATVGPFYNASDFLSDTAPTMGNAWQALVTLIVIAAFAVIALLLNRRALLVAGLVSAGTATWVLVRSVGLDNVGGSIAITLIVLGAAVLLLGVGWNGARRSLLRFVPESGVASRLFPRVEADG